MEYINGQKRWILSLQKAPPHELRAMPSVIERMRNVRTFRAKSKRKSTLAIADSPERYNIEVIPDKPFLVIPEVSSERREYVPIGWLEPPTIPSNKLRFIKDADLWHFGILTSRIHMGWVRHVGGRLKSDFQYSIGIDYNAFPWPEATDEQREKIRALAQSVLDARAEFPNSTLADLYDVDVMPHQLRKAHQELDKTVDKLYRPAPFTGDRDRVEHLFGLYERLIAPLARVARKPKKPRSSKKPNVHSHSNDRPIDAEHPEVHPVLVGAGETNHEKSEDQTRDEDIDDGGVLCV
jgi:hypothetical protein